MPSVIDPGDPTGFQRKGGIFVPGDQRPAEKRSTIDKIKSIITPVKRLLTPGGKPEAEEDPLVIAKPFNHHQRRWHMRYATRLQRRNIRGAARKERRLAEQMHRYATQHFDVKSGKIVRANSRGESLVPVTRPITVKIRPRVGYLQVNGPARLGKSETQIKFEIASEAGNHVKAKLDPRIDHLGNPRPEKRLRGSWAPGPAQRGEKAGVAA